MAQADTGNRFGFVDRRRTQGQANNPGTLNGSNWGSVATLRSRLGAINAAYFTNTRLDQMTDNDMIYALRQLDDAAGI